jgi:hypothetical protein
LKDALSVCFPQPARQADLQNKACACRAAARQEGREAAPRVHSFCGVERWKGGAELRVVLTIWLRATHRLPAPKSGNPQARLPYPFFGTRFALKLTRDPSGSGME